MNDISAGFYEMLGRLVARIAWRQYGTHVKVAGGLALFAGVAAAVLFARRGSSEDVPPA